MVAPETAGKDSGAAPTGVIFDLKKCDRAEYPRICRAPTETGKPTRRGPVEKVLRTTSGGPPFGWVSLTCMDAKPGIVVDEDVHHARIVPLLQ